MNYKKLIQHEKALKKEVFFVEKKWPHFDILFKDIKNISNTLKKNSVVVRDLLLLKYFFLKKQINLIVIFHNIP